MDAEGKMKRIFFAVNVPEEVREEIAENVLSQIKGEGLKKVEKENLHITLAFLGYVPAEKVKEIEGKIGKLSFPGKFEAELNGIGEFGGRVLWIGVKKGGKELEEIAGKLNEALGLKERFHAHLTIARNKRMDRARFRELVEGLKKKEFSRGFRAESVDLMESVLAPKGPEYKKLFGFRL